MKLPNGQLARIDVRKLLNYALSTEHDDGRHKAKLFRKLLDIDTESSELLMLALRDAAAHADATLGRKDQYGQRYHINFEFKGCRGRAIIRSAWIVRSGETLPDLITCYIL